MNERILAIAKSEAEASTFRRARLGALILDKGRVVARGRNSTKTHPIADRFGMYCLHAEIDALRKCNNGDTLLVVRVNRKNELTCAKPCDNCLAAIKEAGIKRILFSDWAGNIISTWP